MVSRGLRSVVLSNTQTIAGRADNLVWKYTVILSSGIDHDLSILTLCCPLQMSRSVSPVCLPPSFYTGVVARVSGWGTMEYSDISQPDRLMEVNVTVLDNTECNEAYANEWEDITESMICARDGGKNSCNGDSGGKKAL